MTLVEMTEEQGSAAAVFAAAGADVARALAGVLADGVDVHRCLAAGALGRVAGPDAVAPLIEALLDEDEDVRAEAAGALARIGDPRAAAPLLQNLLGDPCGEVKRSAVAALGRLGHKDVVPWLRRLVKERDQDIAWDEDEFHTSGWDDWLDIQVAAIAALADLGDAAAVPEIVAAIRDEDGQDLTGVGFKALARLGAAGVEALAGFLDAEDVRLRRRAAAVLGGISDDHAAAAIRRALGDSVPEVRRAAARALAARDPSDGRLVVLFRDPDPAVRSEAIRLVGRQHAEWTDGLAEEQSDTVRQAALEVLADRPDLLPAETAVEFCGGALEAADPQQSRLAARALAAIAPEIARTQLVELLEAPGASAAARLGAIEALGGIGGDAAVAAASDALADDDREVRLAAVRALLRMAGADGEWPNPAGEILLWALRGELVPAPEPEPAPEQAEVEAPTAEQPETPDAEAFPTSTLDAILREDPALKEAAALPEAGIELSPEDIERLAFARRQPRKRNVAVMAEIAPHEDTPRLAARVLGDLARPEAAAALAVAFEAGDTEMRRLAAGSLACLCGRLDGLPDQGAAAVLAAAADADPEIRLYGVRALGSQGMAKFADRLIECLGDEDSFVRTEAVGALARLGRDAPAIEFLMVDPDPGVRLAAAESVVRLRGPGATRALVDFAFGFGGYHRQAAGRLLRQADAGEANARLLEVLGDRARIRDWQVAIEALAELNASPAAGDDATHKQQIEGNLS